MKKIETKVANSALLSALFPLSASVSVSCCAVFAQELPVMSRVVKGPMQESATQTSNPSAANGPRR